MMKSMIIFVVAIMLAMSGCAQYAQQQNVSNATDVSGISSNCDLNKDGKVDSVEQKMCSGNQTQNGNPGTGKCGDGTCDDVEKRNNVCPQDCGTQNLTGKGNFTVQTPSESGLEINLHALATGEEFGNILKLYNPLVDEENGRLYVTGSKSTYFGIVDLETEELVETFDMGVPGGYLFFNDGDVYMFDIAANRYYLVDVGGKKISETGFSRDFKPGGPVDTYGDYTFKMTGYTRFADGKTGFPADWRQDLNAAYGVIEIYDSTGNNVGEIVLPEPDSLYFTISPERGRLYTTNTGDGSIGIIDLTKLESTNYCEAAGCLVKEIDVGDSADEVIADSSGNIYIRNRLGGSVIYKYNIESGDLTIIDNENHDPGGIAMWPTGMELGEDENQLYVLSHYGALIDVIDTGTNEVVGKIEFETELKPRTDAISAMAMDKGRERIYAVWPELGVIGVADGANESVRGMIDLAQYGFDKEAAANAGPNQVSLAVDEETGTLYVYLSKEKRMLAFDGETLEEKDGATGSSVVLLAAGMESFSGKGAPIAVDGENGAIYSVETKGAPRVLQTIVHEYLNGTETRKWALDPVLSIPPSLYFDFENSVFYVAYFETAVVKQYSLD